jgi:hypothetical protein
MRLFDSCEGSRSVRTTHARGRGSGSLGKLGRGNAHLRRAGGGGMVQAAPAAAQEAAQTKLMMPLLASTASAISQARRTVPGRSWIAGSSSRTTRPRTHHPAPPSESRPVDLGCNRNPARGLCGRHMAVALRRRLSLARKIHAKRGNLGRWARKTASVLSPREPVDDDLSTETEENPNEDHPFRPDRPVGSR